MLRIALATALIATVATPALANRLAHSPAQVSAALKEGCTVQHVHTPAGKIVHSPAIVRCDKVAVAKTAPTPNVQVATAN
ncbi:hypothetical protein U1872_06710 [Sphingomonas sp. RB3P16]|uniref:hypothetical protein n=1 Tax=Parasphingomonas frigoris TaxID=3096163 RepID=UPI002FCAA35A